MSLTKSHDMIATWNESVDWALTKDQSRQLAYAKLSEEPAKALYKEVKDIINKKSYTGWTTKGHTAVDVQIFAYGKGSEQFIGSQNNTDIAKKLINFIQ